ncbi:MAG: hypothetical protein ACE5HO_18550 [bacterium]
MTSHFLHRSGQSEARPLTGPLEVRPLTGARLTRGQKKLELGSRPDSTDPKELADLVAGREFDHTAHERFDLHKKQSAGTRAIHKIRGPFVSGCATPGLLIDLRI